MADEKLSQEQKYCIKARLQKGELAKKLAKEYGVSLCLTYRIWKPKKYPYYKCKRENTGVCIFCGKSLKGKLPSAKVCDAACKQNYKRLGSGGVLTRHRTRTKLTKVSTPRKLDNVVPFWELRSAIPKESWLEQTVGKLRVVNSTNLPPAWCPNSNKYFDFVCKCGNVINTQFYKVTTGQTLSCGCGSQSSGQEREFYQDILKFFPDAQHRVRGLLSGNTSMELDVWVPSLRIGIEYNGLYWHSELSPGYKRGSEYRKYKLCQREGIRLLQIYTDDWQTRRPIFESLLQTIAGTGKNKRVYHLVPEEVTREEAQNFLNKNHYLSGSQVSGSLYVGLFSKKVLYAVSVFRKRKDGEYEWSRHSVKLGYVGWNTGQRCLDFVLKVLGSITVVSFSDNRVYTGDMYRKLGFVRIGETGQSYEYTNGKIRRHKFDMRVKRGENERLRAWTRPDGIWSRLYDSRKIKWVLNPT